MPPTQAWSLPYEFNGEAVTTRFNERDGLPVSATTIFYDGLLVYAEHELLHAIGFAESYRQFRARVDAQRHFKDAAGKTLAILTPVGTHVDPTKTVDGFNQARSIMQPSPMGRESGDFEKNILNAAFDWSGQGGLKIDVKYTGKLISDADKQWIQDVVNRVEELFGPPGENAKQFTWDVQRVDPPAPAPQQKPTPNSRGESITYDAQSEMLTIKDDFMIASSDDDPIAGAQVFVPSLNFTGHIGEGLYYFFNESFEDLLISKDDDVFFRGTLSALLYDATQNYFYWTVENAKIACAPSDSIFFDPGLADLSSSLLNDILGVLDPGSPAYRAGQRLYFTYQPDIDFALASLNFTQDASSGGFNGLYASDPIPEPSTLVLVIAGIGMLIGAKKAGERFGK
ncbi:PEP-CTERM sorting domain-containing protein [Geoalkalibacter halelectricus]|uniref:PEP-CTERM sorting domain-containing protein n=1 Tax=Geoalkalibacter halelectricus TaxID=2847045 RepID=UPI003D1A5585